MIVVLTLFFFILGTIIGSFLNVVILRYNTGVSFVEGRSRCFSCGRDLRWFELIPLISYIGLGGKCARCKSKISPQYFLVELGTGLVFLALFLKFKYLLPISLGIFIVQMLFWMVVMSLFIVIFVYDIRHKIIPDGLVLVLSLLSLIKLCLIISPIWVRGSLLDFFAGPILALPFALLWLVSRGRWMGLGDAKLMLPIGWLLGLVFGLSAIIVAFWVGAVVSISILVYQRLSGKNSLLTMKSEIPFAPFLIIGFGLAFFLSVQVINVQALTNLFI